LTFWNHSSARRKGRKEGDMKMSTLTYCVSLLSTVTTTGSAFRVDAGELVSRKGTGTIAYSAPEVISGRPCGYKADIWALGVLMYILLSGTWWFVCVRAFPSSLPPSLRPRLKQRHSLPLPPSLPPSLLSGYHPIRPVQRRGDDLIGERIVKEEEN